jgi:hypothetical protein
MLKLGLRPPKRGLKDDTSLAAPKRDLKSAEIKIKKERDQDGMPPMRKLKKKKPGTKNKFSLSIEDMLAEGERDKSLSCV